MQITIEISEEHVAVLRHCDFDGELPDEITTLEGRVQWYVASYCDSVMAAEAYDRIQWFKLLLRLQDSYRNKNKPK